MEKIPAITVNYSFKICCITNALGTKDDIVGGKHSYHFEMKSSSEKLVSGGKKDWMLIVTEHIHIHLDMVIPILSAFKNGLTRLDYSPLCLKTR